MGFDLTKGDNGIAGRIHQGTLMHRMGTMTLEQLKTEFLSVIVDPTVSASKATRYKWIDINENTKTHLVLMHVIKNLYLKGAGMGVPK